MWRILGHIPQVTHHKSRGRRITIDSNHVDSVMAHPDALNDDDTLHGKSCEKLDFSEKTFSQPSVRMCAWLPSSDSDRDLTKIGLHACGWLSPFSSCAPHPRTALNKWWRHDLRHGFISMHYCELAQKSLLGESFVNQPMSIHHWKRSQNLSAAKQTNKMSFKDNKYYNKIMSSEKSYVYAATAVAVIAVAAGTVLMTTRKTK